MKPVGAVQVQEVLEGVHSDPTRAVLMLFHTTTCMQCTVQTSLLCCTSSVHTSLCFLSLSLLCVSSHLTLCLAPPSLLRSYGTAS